MRRASCITGGIVSALMAALAGCSDSAICHTTELECGGTCIAPASDPRNCGACGNVCTADQTCESGTCTTTTHPATCDAPKLLCGSDCVDPMVTAAHCGTCAIACAADADCIAGVCDGPLALLQTALSTTPAARDAFVLQDGTLDLTKLDTAGFATDRVIDHALLPSGAVVLVAAEDFAGVPELFVVSPRGGTLLKLNPPLPPGASVRPGLVVSRDGGTLLYRADQDTPGIVELYAVSIAHPGVTVKVNGALVDGGAVSRVFALSGDGHRAAYVATEDTATLEEAYTVDLTTTPPGAPVKLNPTITGGVFDLAMTDDGAKVVYRAPDPDTNAAKIFEVDVATPGVANAIDNGDGPTGFVTDYALTSDGAVVYTGSPNELAQQLWRAPLTTPFTPTLLVPNTNIGFVREFAVSPDGAHVFYRVSAQQLWRVDVATTTTTQLSLQTQTSEDLTADFALARNGHTLAFRAGADGAEGGFQPTPGTQDPNVFDFATPSLYALDLTAGSAAPVKLSPALVDGHNGVSGGYAVTADARVLYRADETTLGVIDAYLCSAATAGAPTKVSPTLDATTDSDQVSRLAVFP